MTLSDLQACLDSLGVNLSLRLVVQAPAGAMTPEVMDSLKAHKRRLMAMLAEMDDRTGPVGLPTSEPTRPVGPTDRGPSSADRRHREEVARVDPPGAPGDAEAVAAIDLAYGDSDPAPAGPTRYGPRDYRLGDRWLPWHFEHTSPAPLHEPADAYDRQERAAIMGFDGGLTREAAERATGLPPSTIKDETTFHPDDGA